MAVTYTDVETSLGRSLSGAEQAQATQWIADAYMLIQNHFKTDYIVLDPSLVDYVVRESVAGRLRNGAPDGMSSITVAVDDANVTRRYENGDGTVTDWLLDGWLDLLAPDRDSQAFSTRPGFEPDCRPLDWSTS